MAFGRPGGSVGFRGLSTAEEGVGKSAPAVPAVHAPCGCGRGLVHSPAEAQPPGCLAVGCSAAPHSRGGGQGEGANRGAVLTVPPARGGEEWEAAARHPPARAGGGGAGLQNSRLSRKVGRPGARGWQGPGGPPAGLQRAAQGIGMGQPPVDGGGPGWPWPAGLPGPPAGLPAARGRHGH